MISLPFPLCELAPQKIHLGYLSCRIWADQEGTGGARPLIALWCTLSWKSFLRVTKSTINHLFGQILGVLLSRDTPLLKSWVYYTVFLDTSWSNLECLTTTGHSLDQICVIGTPKYSWHCKILLGWPPMLTSRNCILSVVEFLADSYTRFLLVFIESGKIDIALEYCSFVFGMFNYTMQYNTWSHM